MRRLLSFLTIIFFCFLSNSYSENISDFEIEGISVDDYVFKYFTNQTLKNSKQTESLFSYYDSSTYGSALADNDKAEADNENQVKTGILQVSIDTDNNKLETYDEVQVEYFGTTEVIKSVSGVKYFDERNCDKKQKEAVNDLSKILLGDYNLDKRKSEKNNMIVNFYDFKLNSGGSIEVVCYEKTKKDSSWISALVLTINSKGIKNKKNDEEEQNKKIDNQGEFVKIKPRQDQIKSGRGGRVKF